MIDLQYKKPEILNGKNSRLLGLLLSDNPNQKELDTILRSCLPEKPNNEVLLLLQNFHSLHPSLVFPNTYYALFKGIKALYHHSSSRLNSHFGKIGNKLTQAGISFSLIKGGAMCCLNPDSLRFMEDIDVLVKKEDFSKSLEIVKQLGYRYCVDVHSADIHDFGSSDGIMDIHKFIPLNSGKGKLISNDIIERSEKTVCFGTDCLIPCNEDLLFILVTNLCRNLLDKTRSTKIMLAILDFKHLIAKGIEWDIFIEDCIKTRSQAEVSFTVTLINSIVPDLFPEQLERIAEKTKMEQFLNLFLFRREVLVPLQKKRSELRLWLVIRDPRKTVQFLLLRPLYLFLKLFKYSPRMVSTRIIRMLSSYFASHSS